MRILIVEDDFVSRKILTKILSEYGEIDIAVDGEEAVAAYELALEEHSPYDLIMLDIIMPRLNGCDALLRIRENEIRRGIDTRSRVTAFMTTALDDAEAIEAAFVEAGCDGYIVKPYDAKKINGELKKLGLI